MMIPCSRRRTRATSSRSTPQAQPSDTTADATLDQETRTIEDGEIVDLTALVPSAEDEENPDHVSSSMAEEETMPGNESAPPPHLSLPKDKGKGREVSPSSDGRATTSRWAQSHDSNRRSRIRATTIVPEGGRRHKRRAPDDGQDSEYSSSSRKSSRAHTIDHETAEALNKQVQAALHRSTLTRLKHDQLASQLDTTSAALMAIGKELHQAEEIRLQDAATLEDVQKALRPRGECDTTRPRSRQSAANEPSRDVSRKERDKQRMPPPAVPVEQDVRFRNGPQEQPAAPTDSRKMIQQIVRDQVASEPDSETTTESLELEVAHWQRKEAAAARRHTRALELLAKNAEETVAHSHTAQLPDEQLTQAVQDARQARAAYSSRLWIHNAGLTGDTRHKMPPEPRAQNAPDPEPDPGPGPVRAHV